jgi:hypothetical protein
MRPKSREILEQQMAPREQAGQSEAHHLVLAAHDGVDRPEKTSDLQTADHGSIVAPSTCIFSSAPLR